jgi:hypothetical protein
MADQHNYQAFLVRLWTVAQNGGFVWRASAQDAHTGGSVAFADLAGLCAFLSAVTETAPGYQTNNSDKQAEDTAWKGEQTCGTQIE